VQDAVPDATRESLWQDAGVAVLRVGAGLSLFILFGLPKVKDAVAFTLAHRPWPFVDFNRRIGLPFPLFVAWLQTLNESVCALAVACGALTRWAAGCLAVGFAVAAVCSLKMQEQAWLTAACLSLIFTTLAMTGAGRFSIDHMRPRRRSQR
jgi:uncharacterized membrane protein YphA (DoxX/SURF4 family)